MSKKYDRKIWDKYEDRHCVVDVYRVLDAFGVRCPATAHAVKKLLCLGRNGSAEKGHNDEEQDLAEAAQSIVEAQAMLKQKRRARGTQSETTPEPQVEPLPHSFLQGDDVKCLVTGTYTDVQNTAKHELVQIGEFGTVMECRTHFVAVRFYDPYRWVLMRPIHVKKVVKGRATNGQ